MSSEIAQFRQLQAAEEESANLGLYGPAAQASHDAITYGARRGTRTQIVQGRSRSRGYRAVGGPIMECQCHDGIICDACAAAKIEALNQPFADYVELTPGVLTETEQAVLRASVAGWLGTFNEIFSEKEGATA